jgi:hypothetical protein
MDIPQIPMTLISYELTYPAGRTHRTAERPDDDYVAKMGLKVVQRTDSYQIGQTVEVAAFSKWRRGTVTKLGRSRVTVDYVTNAAGTNRRVKAFGAGDIRPVVG